MTATSSPLLRGEGLPEYSAINPEMVSRDIPALLEALNEDFSALELTLEQAMGSDAPLRWDCLLYTSPSPRDRQKSRMPSSA